MHTYSHNIVFSCVFCNLSLEHSLLSFLFYIGEGEDCMSFLLLDNRLPPPQRKKHEFAISHFTLVRTVSQPNEFFAAFMMSAKAAISHKAKVLFQAHPGCWQNSVLVVVWLSALFLTAANWNSFQPCSCLITLSTTWQFLLQGQQDHLCCFELWISLPLTSRARYIECVWKDQTHEKKSPF